MTDFEILEKAVSRNDLFEKMPQFWNVPLTIAQLINWLILRLLGRGLERLVKSLVGKMHSQIGPQNQQGNWSGPKDRLHVRASRFAFLLTALERINVHRHEHSTVNLVRRIHIRT